MMSERAISAPTGFAVSEARQNGDIFQLDAAEFTSRFNHKPYLFNHKLAGHHLFSLSRLIELAKHHPENLVEYNAGNIPVSIDARLTPRNGLSIEETIRRIEECSSWMVIKRIESDPEYNELLNNCLDELETHTDGLEPGMFERAASVFISSPGSVTPYHIDHETNFLLQIRGSKILHTFNKEDRSILPAHELEDYHSSSTLFRNLIFKDEFQLKSNPFELTPGKVVHVPSTTPHWVKNGDAVSISFSAAFQTKATDRVRNVHRFNAILRSKGLEPTPPGESAMLDAAKDFGYRVFRRGRRILIGDPEPMVEHPF